MKLTILLIAAVVLCGVMLAQPGVGDETLSQYVEEQIDESRRLTDHGNFAQAADVLDSLRGRYDLEALGPEAMSNYYNLACAYSVAKQDSEAMICLQAAVDHGWMNADHAAEDSDLENIRQQPAFETLIGRMRHEHEFWENPVFKTPYKANISDDEKIAGLSRLWMEAKYNFAFFDQVPGLNWDSLYFAYLPKVLATGSTLAYYRVLQSFYAYLQDSHTGVMVPSQLSDSTYAYAAMATQLIDDKVIVVRVFDDSLRRAGIQPGTLITTVDGTPVHEYVEQNILPYLASSTHQSLMDMAYGYAFLTGYAGQHVVLGLRDRKGRDFQHILTLGFPSFPSRPSVEFKHLQGNIAYVALNTFGDERVPAIFDSLYPQIKTADGLILDVRRNGGGSSNIGWDILAYLTDKPYKSTQWKTRDYMPSYRAWGRGTSWYYGSPWEMQPHGSDYFTKPVAVLTSSRTFSAAEDFCAVFDAMHRGKLIGQPTGGSTGQPLLFALPGGGSARVCTKHDSYSDGTEFVGIGILPDIAVKPTIRDIRADRDPVLSAAEGYLRQSRKP